MHEHDEYNINVAIITKNRHRRKNKSMTEFAALQHITVQHNKIISSITTSQHMTFQ